MNAQEANAFLQSLRVQPQQQQPQQPQPQPQPQPPPQQQPQPQPQPQPQQNQAQEAQLGPPVVRNIQKRPAQIPRYVSLSRHFYDVDDDDDESDEEVVQNVIQFLPNTIFSVSSFLFLKPTDRASPSLIFMLHDCFDVKIVQNGLIYSCRRPLRISNIAYYFSSSSSTIRDFSLYIPIHEGIDEIGIKDMRLLTQEVGYVFSLARVKNKIQTSIAINDEFTSTVDVPLIVSYTHNYVIIRFKEGNFDIPAGLSFFVEIKNLALPEDEIKLFKPKTKSQKKEGKEEKDEKKDK